MDPWRCPSSTVHVRTGGFKNTSEDQRHASLRRLTVCSDQKRTKIRKSFAFYWEPGGESVKGRGGRKKLVKNRPTLLNELWR